MTTKKNRNAKLAADQSMIDGVHGFLSTLPSFPVGSTSVTPADIVKVFQDRVDAARAVQTAEAARTAAVKTDLDKRAQTAAFVRSFRRIVLGMFSESPDTLAAFGLKAPRAPKKTVEVLSAAVAKSKATREARNTMGTRQKKGVKGNVAGITVTPVIAPSPVAPGQGAGTPTEGTGAAAAPHLA
jgi:hypothetical protein